MTNAQVTALQYGLIGFLAVWSTILVPQLVLQFARYGRPRVRGLVTTAAVVLYASMTLAVVFLPLPGAHSRRLEQTVQLRPFQWIGDIHTELLKHGLPAAHWFTTQTFQQVALNVLLFVPLGVFARMLWRRGLAGTLAIGAAASLAIEITQLTANFGTAPFAYRIFDVDDLMTNTFGAGVGWLFAAVLLSLRGVPSTVHAQTARRERVDFAQAR
ncbi:VanZ family protein [Amycolatopsis sp. PS_44_ISF1]|uniref:VanZ family protein n=1 Tax=Amycolatopsis sp. PS_44_ISF1 TaxID=2974917 RepID=UPI0028DE25B6|nr:VanZ family protein [Amycolatopsis sp. PS_44_ISF1]MDT8910579.1 VanZ family protein [Amycolatopsis sp. PS_44_ISF1]MDT8916342.1 VanZ family protein [Amycolatopsis sp. PS_44_ISF1]MDT8916350.1 VanZ family protein [Amycolatopsis sp. PS_44_ISF1]